MSQTLEDGRRNSPYEPRMMVKVLIHAYATGVFSSRKIALVQEGSGREFSELVEDLLSRWLKARR